MKLKNYLILISLFLTLIISIGVISASEDLSDASLLEDGGNVSSAELNDSSMAVNPAPAATSSPEKTVENSTNEKTVKTAAKISTKVSVDQVANEYKKSKYFKVKVKDKKGIAVKNVKIKLKIYTGSKYKSYIIKTNSKGIAKFNTKSLKLGNHKVVISSANAKYKISKSSKIFIGKKHYAIVKPKHKKVLKNKDVIGLKIVNDEDEKEAKVVYKKKPKYTKVIKAIFYLKNKKTGKIIKKTDSAEFDDGRWGLPDKDFSKKYKLVKVKVYYLSSK